MCFIRPGPLRQHTANALCESACNSGVACIAILKEVVLRPDPRVHNIRLVRLGIFVFSASVPI